MNNKYTIIVSMMLLVWVTLCQAQSNVWSKQAGGKSEDAGSDIVLDDEENCYITGWFANQCKFDDTVITGSSEFSDFYLAKYDKNGRVIWVRKATSSERMRGNALAYSPDGYILATGFFIGTVTFGKYTLPGHEYSSRIFIAKYDLDGNVEWVKSVPGLEGSGTSRDITVDEMNMILVTGSFQGTAIFGSDSLISAGSSDDIFIAKYDPFGNAVWAKKAGGDFYQTGLGVTTDADRNIIVSGHFFDKVNFETQRFKSLDKCDLFLAKYSSRGKLIWVKQGSSPGFASGIHVEIGPDNYVYCGGYFESEITLDDTTLYGGMSRNLIITKYDSRGNLTWVKQGGGLGDFYPVAMSFDKKGDFAITGSYDSTVTIGNTVLDHFEDKDIFIAKYNQNAKCLWVKVAGGRNSDRSGGIVYNNNGEIYLTGVFESDLTFDSETLYSSGNSDVLFAKIHDDTYPLTHIDSQHRNNRTFFLEQNYPNPFNNQTKIRYQITTSSPVEMAIYSLTGQKIKTLVNRIAQPDIYYVTWDGRDEKGIKVASGVYLLKMECGQFSSMKKISLLK